MNGAVEDAAAEAKDTAAEASDTIRNAGEHATSGAAWATGGARALVRSRSTAAKRLLAAGTGLVVVAIAAALGLATRGKRPASSNGT
jgi:hypothetical protein